MIGTRIKQLRTAKGLSQRQLAARAGIARSHVGFIESGRIQMPSMKTLLKLSVALGAKSLVADAARAA